MKAWINTRTFKIIEAAFYWGSLYYTILSLTAYIMAFHGVLTVDDFSTVNNLYWPSLLMYSTMRKARRLGNETMPHRISEMILLVWLGAGLIGTTVTLVARRDMFPLMKEFALLYLILLGIFLGANAVEKLIGSILAPKK